ncbi:zinc finger BED domain-containing protein RICESLEEPER 2-like [Tasmannia lanceolata]|uniref:zinc finger BED domain-containing protein RICESLEEPER 2-like n=1 Tax=Tasmannia lanceolata TaxID=3420 RepID=UPI004062A833
MSEDIVDDDVNDGNHSPPSLRRRKLRSVIWNDFEKEEDSNGVLWAKCKHCKRNLTGSSTSGTTHLKRHLAHCPKNKNQDVRQKFLSWGQAKTDGSTCISNFKFDQNQSRQDLAHMIMLHEYPFKIVEHPGFIKFAKNLQPLFKMVSRNTIKSDCLAIYKKEKEKLSTVFETIPGRISLTTDMWTSNQTLGYICLTAHFVDHDWVLNKRIINFAVEPSPHTAINLCDTIYRQLLEWKIDGKISTMTVDNLTTNDSMCARLKEKLHDTLPLEGKFFHVRCCAHILNLVVQSGLEVINNVIHKVRESVKYVKASQSRQQIFQELARVSKISSEKKVCLDVPTRWNSTFLMLQVALEYKDAFLQMTQCDLNYQVAPTKDEWENAKIICNFLKVFYDATNIFSATKSPTANIFFPELVSIRCALHEAYVCDKLFMRSIVERMKDKFDKYWGECSLILSIAVVLDPRYKLKLLEYYYPKIYYFERSEMEIQKAKNAIRDLYREYERKQASSTERSSLSGFNFANEERVGLNTNPSRQDKMNLFHQFAIESSSRVERKGDLDHYLDEAIIIVPPTDEFDVLSWWKSNALNYPTLSIMARDILGIPISTVASESAFSTGGRVLDQYRSSLLPETVEALICGQDWLRASIDGTYIFNLSFLLF